MCCKNIRIYCRRMKLLQLKTRITMYTKYGQTGTDTSRCHCHQPSSKIIISHAPAHSFYSNPVPSVYFNEIQCHSSQNPPPKGVLHPDPSLGYNLFAGNAVVVPMDDPPLSVVVDVLVVSVRSWVYVKDLLAREWNGSSSISRIT